MGTVMERDRKQCYLADFSHFAYGRLNGWVEHALVFSRSSDMFCRGNAYFEHDDNTGTLTMTESCKVVMDIWWQGHAPFGYRYITVYKNATSLIFKSHDDKVEYDEKFHTDSGHLVVDTVANKGDHFNITNRPAHIQGAPILFRLEIAATSLEKDNNNDVEEKAMMDQFKSKLELEDATSAPELESESKSDLKYGKCDAAKVENNAKAKSEHSLLGHLIKILATIETKNMTNTTNDTSIAITAHDQQIETIDTALKMINKMTKVERIQLYYPLQKDGKTLVEYLKDIGPGEIAWSAQSDPRCFQERINAYGVDSYIRLHQVRSKCCKNASCHAQLETQSKEKDSNEFITDCSLSSFDLLDFEPKQFCHCGSPLSKSVVNAIEEYKQLNYDQDKAVINFGDDLWKRGVKVGWLESFTNHYCCWDWPTWRVVQYIIKPETFAAKCRYIELPHMSHRGSVGGVGSEYCDIVGGADLFLSHCWTGTWGCLVSSAMNLLEKDTRVWCDIFAVRQWPGSEADMAFDEVVRRCKGLILVINNIEKINTINFVELQAKRDVGILDENDRKKTPFLRVWCLVEILAAMSNNIPVLLSCGAHTEHGDFIESRSQLFVMQYIIDITKAKATKPSDVPFVLSKIHSTMGFDAVNRRLRGAVVGAMTSNYCPAVSQAAVGLQEKFNVLIDSCQTLLDQGEDELCYESLCPAIIVAAASGFIPQLQYLLQLFPNSHSCCDVHGKSPLMYATQGGHHRAIEILLEAGADPNKLCKSGWTAFMYGAAVLTTSMLSLFTQCDADPTLGEFNPLMIAAQDGNIDMVNFLLQICPKSKRIKLLDTRDNIGYTPLRHAVYFSYLDLADILISAGANINAIDNWKCSILGWAIRSVVNVEKNVKWVLGHPSCIVDADALIQLNTLQTKEIPEKENIMILCRERAQRNLEGQCNCGSLRLLLGDMSCAWGAFICHCSMCPAKTYTSADTTTEAFDPGMAFIAIPRSLFQNAIAHKDDYDLVRTSSFAQRGRCKACNMWLTMDYDCEEHTVWITLDCIHDKEQIFETLDKKAHIHCHNLEGKTVPIKAGDGILAYDSWQPWLDEMDPCRPKGMDLPEVCLECFQMKTKCAC